MSTNPQHYYALTLTVQGASTAAFYSLSPAPNLSISQGGATLSPSAPSQQMVSVSVYPQTLQLNAAAGNVNAGVNIIASEFIVAGRVLVSPPVNVATAVTLYGNGGKQIGQYIVDPGSEGGLFSFTATAEQSIPADEAGSVIETLLGQS